MLKAHLAACRHASKNTKDLAAVRAVRTTLTAYAAAAAAEISAYITAHKTLQPKHVAAAVALDMLLGEPLTTSKTLTLDASVRILLTRAKVEQIVQNFRA